MVVLVDTGTIIKAKRQEAGTSIRQLAAMANISPSYLTRIEAGKSDPTTDMAAKLLTLVGYTLTVQRVTRTPAAIAATRKACDPAWDGLWNQEAQEWLERYQRAGWVDLGGQVKPGKRPDLLIRTGVTNPLMHRPGAQRYTPINSADTWLDMVERLATTGIDYALTGGPAANQMLPMGGATDMAVYVTDPKQAADICQLAPDPTGWAVIAQFNNIGEIGRYQQATGIYADGVWLANPNQVIIDCAGIPKAGLDQAEFLTGRRY